MGAADKVADGKVAFVFTRPGKSPEDASKPKDDGDGYDREDKADETDDKAPTREELGRELCDALEAHEYEAVYEAVRKINDNPDAE